MWHLLQVLRKLHGIKQCKFWVGATFKGCSLRVNIDCWERHVHFGCIPYFHALRQEDCVRAPR
jgi:hypothetical protein